MRSLYCYIFTYIQFPYDSNLNLFSLTVVAKTHTNSEINTSFAWVFLLPIRSNPDLWCLCMHIDGLDASAHNTDKDAIKEICANVQTWRFVL